MLERSRWVTIRAVVAESLNVLDLIVAVLIRVPPHLPGVGNGADVLFRGEEGVVGDDGSVDEHAELLINGGDGAICEPVQTIGGSVELLATSTAVTIFTDDEHGGSGSEHVQGSSQVLGIRLEIIEEHAIQDLNLLLALAQVAATAGRSAGLDLVGVGGDDDGSEEERDKAGKEHFVDF